MRKRNSNAKLLNLPEATQRALFALSSDSHLTVDEIRERITAPVSFEFPDGTYGFGEGDVGKTAIYAFLSEWRTKVWRESLKRSAAEAKEIVDEGLAESGAVVDQVIEAGIRDAVLDGLAQGNLDAKGMKSLFSLILKSRQQSMDERKLAILEKKAAAFDQIEEAAEDDNLTPEQRLERIRKGLKI